MARLCSLLPLLFIACAPPSDSEVLDEGTTPSTSDSPGTQTETSTTTSSSSTETTPTTSSTEPPIPNGVYMGSFELYAYLVEISSITDNCVGTVTLDVDAAADPPIVGTAACTFEGIVGQYLDEQTAEISGSADETGAVSGDIIVYLSEDESYTQPWSGTFSTDTIEATFTGDSPLDGGDLGTYTVAFDGTIIATLQ